MKCIEILLDIRNVYEGLFSLALLDWLVSAEIIKKINKPEDQWTFINAQPGMSTKHTKPG